MKHLTIPCTIIYFIMLFVMILSCNPACALEGQDDNTLPDPFQSGNNGQDFGAARQVASEDKSSQAFMPEESDQGDVTGRQVLKAWLDHRRREIAEVQGSAPPDQINEGDLAKQSQNPVANLASLPFQCNAYFGTNPGYRTSYIINIQPVVPFELSTKWTLITRNIIPIKSLPIGEKLSSYGVGDITSSFFFSPTSTGSFT